MKYIFHHPALLQFFLVLQGDAIGPGAFDKFTKRAGLAERFGGVQRGHFDHLFRRDPLLVCKQDCAQAQFIQEPAVQGHEVLVVMEMTLKSLTSSGGIDNKGFLDRVDLLGSLGKTVLVSNYLEYYRLAQYLFRYTKQMIGLAMGIPGLREIFDEKYYTDLEGGILESFGRLFKNALKLYVYPLCDSPTGAMITAGNLQVAPHLRHLNAYLLENHVIQAIEDYNTSCLPIFSKDVLSRIKSDDPSWEEMVPPQVAAVIKERRLFDYHGNGELKR